MNLPYNLLIVFYYFLPIWAFLIWRYTPKKTTLNKPIVFFSIEMALFFLTVWLAYNPMRIPKITDWLHWYTFFLMAYLFIITVKVRYINIGKVLALSLWMVFIAGDWWELPVFIYDGFGFINGWHVWHVSITQWIASHIHRAYVFVTFLLMVVLTKFQFNKKNISLAILGTVISFVTLYPYASYMPMSTITHLICLSLFAGVVWFGNPLVDA